MVPREAVQGSAGAQQGSASTSVPLSDPPVAVHPCAGLLCAYHYYKGPSGRHIAVLLHTGQALFLIGALLLVLAYTALQGLTDIVVQRVVGIFAVELSVSLIVGGFATYTCAQYTKVGGVSAFWAKDILVTLYMRAGGMNVFVGFGVSMVGFNLHEDWLLPFRIAGPMALITGMGMLLGARLYARTPCYRQRQVQASQWGSTTQHCSCPHAHHHHHLHSISSVHVSDGGGVPGPVVVYSSGGGDLVPPTPTTFMTSTSPLMAMGPPQYDTLGPRQESPPSYVLVSPMSPPPTYSEACATPKDLDADRDPGAPPGYPSNYDRTCVCPAGERPLSGSSPDCVVITGSSPDCVVITDLSNSTS